MSSFKISPGIKIEFQNLKLEYLTSVPLPGPKIITQSARYDNSGTFYTHIISVEGAATQSLFDFTVTANKKYHTLL